MRKAVVGLALGCAVAGLLAACSDDAGSPPSEVIEAGAPDDASVDATGQPDLLSGSAVTSRDAGAEAAVARDAPEQADAPADLGSLPLPANVRPPQRIVPGPARLVGAGTSACTHQVPASGDGDRWCAFKRARPELAATELWVINVTKAERAPPVCDGSSPDCLRLTSTLWTDEPFAGPYQDQAHRFEGDTLLFHADALSRPEEPYTGPIWAWRPGWSAARRIASKAYACFGHWNAALAFCVDSITYSNGLPVEFDLLVGAIGESAGGELPKLDRARWQRADREIAFRAGFSDDGDYFVYSGAGAPDSRTAGLRVVKLAPLAAGPFPEILADVMDWQLSFDGTRIFYLSNYAQGVGQLAVADFPSGANPRPLPHRTGRYVVLGARGEDRGVGVFRENSGRFLSEYRILPRPDQPFESVLVFRYRSPLEDFHFSPDQRYTGYAHADSHGFNAFIARNDGLGECMINAQPDRPGFEYMFLQGGGLVFWAEESADDTDGQDGWFGYAADCSGKQRFASRIAFYAAVRNAGLIYADELEGETASLKYLIIDHGRTRPSSPAVRVADGIDLPVAILEPAMDRLVFERSRAGTDTDGLYVFGPMPFDKVPVIPSGPVPRAQIHVAQPAARRGPGSKASGSFDFRVGSSRGRAGGGP